MPLQPEDWNVVVAGRWNPALFTPAAIAGRMFQLPEGTPIEVLVVLDEVHLTRTRHEGITVAPSATQLAVAPERCSFDQLERARSIATASWVAEGASAMLYECHCNQRIGTSLSRVVGTQRCSRLLR